MKKEENWYQELYCFWHGMIYGTDKFPSIFSFNGLLNWRSAWLTALVIYFVVQCISWLEIPLITYISGLLFFYCVLALVQKRCRDFNSAGTFWIIYVTITMILISSIYFVDVFNSEYIYRNIWRLSNFCYAFLVFPMIIPSKPNPDMNLRSPLLKYPFLYTAICWVFAICATLTVNHYAGVTIF